MCELTEKEFTNEDLDAYSSLMNDEYEYTKSR